MGDGRRKVPAASASPVRRMLRYWLVGVLIKIVVRCYVRLRVEGLDRLPPGPCVICFNHQSWSDPFLVVAALPLRPRLSFFGPREEDMRVGARNRLMTWVGTSVPFKPGKTDLLGATRRVEALVDAGGRLALAGEGRIHVGERELTPLSEGPAFFAIRCGIPLVPLAINGTGWLALGRTVRVRVGEPLLAGGRADRAAVDELTARLARALSALLVDFADRPAPGPFGRWLTELFNDWPDGSRPGAPDDAR